MTGWCLWNLSEKLLMSMQKMLADGAVLTDPS
jgi:hypothetical protein